jgi:hypothetical protein
MGAKLNRSDLRKFIKNNRWAWTPFAFLVLFAVPFMVIIEHWGEVKEAYSEVFKVLIHHVDLDK